MTRGRFILLLVVAGFLVRLGMVLLLRDLTEGPKGPSTADDYEFHVLAAHLAEGEGFTNHHDNPTSFRAPGWPLFLAAWYTIAGQAPLGVYALNCALGAVTCVGVYLLGRELLAEKQARWMGLMAVVYLPHAWLATLFFSENLFLPLLTLVLWLMVRAMPTSGEVEGRADGEAARPARGFNMAFIIAAALMLGFAALTRPFALLLVPLLPLALLPNWRRMVAAGLILGLGTLVVVAPWTWRNYQVHERFVLIATNGGSTFYGGNNPRVVSEYRLLGSWLSTTDLPHRDLIEAAPDEVSHDGVEWRLGIDWVRDHPLHFLASIPLKIGRLIFWLPDWDAGPLWATLLRLVAYWPLVPLIILGWYRAWKWPQTHTPRWRIIHLTWLATLVTAVIFWGSPRFRDAAMPVLLLYAGLALSSRAARGSPISHSTAAAPAIHE